MWYKKSRRNWHREAKREACSKVMILLDQSFILIKTKLLQAQGTDQAVTSLQTLCTPCTQKG